MTPSWVTAVFAAFMLVVAMVSAARLVLVRPWQPRALITDTDIAHVLMAVAMAGTLSPRLTTLPSTAWEVIFSVLTAWFCYRVARDFLANGTRALAGGHCVPHLVHSASMLYMFLAVSAAAAGAGSAGGAGGSGPGGMAGPAGSPGALPMLSYPTLAFAFVLILIGYSVWDLDQLSLAARGSAALALAGGPALAGTPAATASSESGGSGSGGSGSGSFGSVSAGLQGLLLAPGTTVAGRIVMGVTMALMLVLMI